MKLRILTPLLVGILSASLLFGCGKQTPDELAHEGMTALSEGRYELALRRFERALRTAPDGPGSARLTTLLGVASWRLGDTSTARTHFENAMRMAADYDLPAYNLGVIMEKQGQISEAVDFFQMALQRNPSSTRPLEYLAESHIRRGEWTSAHNVLLRARQQNPTSPRILNALGLAGLHVEGAVYAVDHFRRALEIDPDYPAALFNLGMLYGDRQKDREGGLAFFRRYLSLPIEHDSSRRRTAENFVAKFEKEIGDSLDPSMRIRAPSPPAAEPVTNPLVPQPRISIPEGLSPFDRLLAEARAALASGQEIDALNLCLQAAAMASRENDPAREEKAYRMAVALCPDQARAQFAFGRFLAETGKHREAMEAFRQAVLLEPNWASALRAAAASAIEANDFQFALEMLRQAVQVSPDNPDTRWALALFYDVHLKLSERARGEYEKFLNRFPDDERAAEARKRLQQLGGPSSASPSPRAAAPDAPPATPRSQVTRIQPVQVATVTASVPLTPRTADATSSTLIAPAPTTAPAPVPTAPAPDLRPTTAAGEVRAQVQRLIDRGAYHQGRDELDQALSSYQDAVRLDPQSSVAYYNMGLIYHQKRQYDAAKTAYIRARDLDPAFNSPRFNLGILFYENSQFDDALRELRQVVQASPAHARAHFILGRIYEETGERRDLARQHYTRFIELEPSAPDSARVRRWLLQN